jgi:uncharacterized membrane protein
MTGAWDSVGERWRQESNAEAWARRSLVAVVLALGLASLLCVSLVEVRGRYEQDSYYRFLDWNLFLAWVPLGFALAAQACARRRLRVAAIAFGVLWLLFFPNAPYLLTDFIHLSDSPSTPLWYDGLMLSAFAWTALVLGFVSLHVMQALWRRVAGAVASWAGVVSVLALASVGVYIGRYVGFNSWDALLHPGRVAHVINTQIDNPIRHPRLAGALVALTGFLTAAYLVFYSLAGLRLPRGRDS